jgi:di/tricarboxylate transporter
MADFHIYYTLLVVLTMVITLVTDRFKPSLVFLLTAALLLVGGVVTVDVFVAGLSNTSILAIFLLIIITGAINEHFNPAFLFDKLFKNTKTASGFIFRMGSGVAAVSSFMNNTPVVAVMMPYVYKWAKIRNVSASKLLMPLSFAAIVGGVITLIGTSTNLVLNGLLKANQLPVLTFTDFFLPGVLISIASIGFLTFFAPRLLNARKDILEQYEENRREYLIEMRLDTKGSAIGKSVEEAGLRNLEDTFLSAIVRDKKQIIPVRPNEILASEDVLLFAGENSSINQLLEKGLRLGGLNQEASELPGHNEILEAVIAQNSGLDRRRVKGSGFREKYDAAIIGIHRKGEKLDGKIGEIDLKTGDLLLLACGPGFKNRNNRSEDLIVINRMRKPKALSKSRRWLFWSGSLLMILLALSGTLGLFETLMGIVLIQGLVGMVDLNSLRKSISFDLLFILISSLCIGQALIDSGSAGYLTDLVFAKAASWSPLALIAIVFVSTFILTSLVTNIAAVSIIFPVVLGLSGMVTVPASVLFLTAAFGASCCFATPFAYQTNLMVAELGNYKFADFIKLGLPLSLLYGLLFMAYVSVYYNLI